MVFVSQHFDLAFRSAFRQVHPPPPGGAETVEVAVAGLGDLQQRRLRCLKLSTWYGGGFLSRGG